MTDPVLDVREHTREGSLCLSVCLERRGLRLVASTAALSALNAELGLTRDDVRALMLEVLELRNEECLPSVLVRPPLLLPHAASRYASVYFHTVGDQVQVGLVWFDVLARATGPADVPTPVRTHMRFVVNRMLAPPAIDRRLLDALLRWDAAQLEAVPLDKT